MSVRFRIHPLAACLVLATGSDAFAATPGAVTVDELRRLNAHQAIPESAIPVTNCDDAGPGSLRDTVAAAASGSTLDLTQLTCSTITLTSGAITIAQSDLSLIGPGAALLAIDGGGQSSLIRHSGTGTLLFDSLTLTHGYLAQSNGRGGCVFSPGNIALYRSVVSDCTLTGLSERGGGLFAIHDLTIAYSVITRNLVDGLGDEANAGGFFVGGYLNMRYSTVSDNEARTIAPAQSGGGGVGTFGDALIVGSTISGNRAGNVAGLALDGHGSAVIVDSTVSGNIMTGGAYGGVYAGVPLSIYNSTIAFNGGVGLVSGYALHLESTIIADNAVDLGLFPGASLSGTHNLIVVANTVPPDTIQSCPHLQPLADNGGPTRTHALIDASPAIDAGNNLRALANDQRGTGFPRAFGANADIGAFEWQGADDAIFGSGFEPGCEH